MLIGALIVMSGAACATNREAIEIVCPAKPGMLAQINKIVDEIRREDCERPPPGLPPEQRTGICTY